MKILRCILLTLAGAMAFLAGLFIGKARTDKLPSTVSETRETYYDTIPYHAPMPKSELALGTGLYTLPTYRFIGGGAGDKARQYGKEVAIAGQDTLTIPMSGTGAGGEPRCCTDSATVELPKIQRHYADSTYEAWVSGPLNPRLDSLIVFAQTTTITKREWKPPKRWHLGLSVGYGMTPDGLRPFVGGTLTYSLFSF